MLGTSWEVIGALIAFAIGFLRVHRLLTNTAKKVDTVKDDVKTVNEEVKTVNAEVKTVKHDVETVSHEVHHADGHNMRSGVDRVVQAVDRLTNGQDRLCTDVHDIRQERREDRDRFHAIEGQLAGALNRIAILEARMRSFRGKTEADA